jgi:hypothetical protein
MCLFCVWGVWSKCFGMAQRCVAKSEILRQCSARARGVHSVIVIVGNIVVVVSI